MSYNKSYDNFRHTKLAEIDESPNNVYERIIGTFFRES